MPAPQATQVALKNYIGSVSADAGGGIVAASAPKGGLITYWDVGARKFLGSWELNDGSRRAYSHLISRTNLQAATRSRPFLSFTHRVYRRAGGAHVFRHGTAVPWVRSLGG